MRGTRPRPQPRRVPGVPPTRRCRDRKSLRRRGTSGRRRGGGANAKCRGSGAVELVIRRGIERRRRGVKNGNGGGCVQTPRVRLPDRPLES